MFRKCDRISIRRIGGGAKLLVANASLGARFYLHRSAGRAKTGS